MHRLLSAIPWGGIFALVHWNLRRWGGDTHESSPSPISSITPPHPTIHPPHPQGPPLEWEICLGSSEFTKVGWGHTRKFTHSHFSGDTHESYPIPTSSIIPPHTTIHPPHPIFTILQRWGRKREWEFIYLSSVEYPGVRNSRRPGVGIGSVESPGVGNHRRPGVGTECLGSSRPSPGVGDLPWLIRMSK